MTEDLAVYMATHSDKCNHVVQEGYIIPIQVGKALNASLIEEVTDDTGDNISEKNRTYCELTALYWMWKNTNHKYIGLYHYRRQFDIDKEKILTVLNTSDIILPKKKIFKISLKEQYIREHSAHDWYILMNILKELYPEYYEFSSEVFEKNQIYRFNMFIMKKDMFDKYCEWLFPILEKVEKSINVEEKNNYQKRYAGFMSERLFTLYVFYNKFKIYETDLIFSQIKINENIKNIVNACIFKFRILFRKMRRKQI